MTAPPRRRNAVAAAIDILISAAGASGPIDLGAEGAAWERSMALNFTAPRRLAERLLPAMRAAK